MRSFLLPLVPFVLASAAVGQAPTIPQVPQASQGAGAGDPLAVGKASIAHGNYADAQKFFAEFLRDNPASSEAEFYAGGAALGLKQFDLAIEHFKHITQMMPKQWSAHNNLALAYAEAGKWEEFDKERALIKASRDSGGVQVNKDEYDLVDRIEANGEVYEVRYFYRLHGKYNVRYVFLHWGKDGKPDHWFQLESDDVDQAFYKKKHPKTESDEDRRYSLDSYSNADGQFSQALMNFYDGEPAYETVRKAVLAALAVKGGDKAPAKN